MLGGLFTPRPVGR